MEGNRWEKTAQGQRIQRDSQGRFKEVELSSERAIAMAKGIASKHIPKKKIIAEAKLAIQSLGMDWNDIPEYLRALAEEASNPRSKIRGIAAAKLVDACRTYQHERHRLERECTGPPRLNSDCSQVQLAVREAVLRACNEEGPSIRTSFEAVVWMNNRLMLGLMKNTAKWSFKELRYFVRQQALFDYWKSKGWWPDS